MGTRTEWRCLEADQGACGPGCHTLAVFFRRMPDHAGLPDSWSVRLDHRRAAGLHGCRRTAASRRAGGRARPGRRRRQPCGRALAAGGRQRQRGRTRPARAQRCARHRRSGEPGARPQRAGRCGALRAPGFQHPWPRRQSRRDRNRRRAVARRLRCRPVRAGWSRPRGARCGRACRSAAWPGLDALWQQGAGRRGRADHAFARGFPLARQRLGKRWFGRRRQSR